jgi:hypothetical protein
MLELGQRSDAADSIGGRTGRRWKNWQADGPPPAADSAGGRDTTNSKISE